MKCGSICDYNKDGACTNSEVAVNTLRRCSGWRVHQIDEDLMVEYTFFVFYDYVDKGGEIHGKVSKILVQRNILESTVAVKNIALTEFLKTSRKLHPDRNIVRRTLRVYHAFELGDLDVFLKINSKGEVLNDL
jgi:hypothetical protein